MKIQEPIKLNSKIKVNIFKMYKYNSCSKYRLPKVITFINGKEDPTVVDLLMTLEKK